MMLQNASWAVFWVGCAGGGIGELTKWYQLRESKNLPVYKSSVFYWLITLGMIACGGLLSLAYDIEKPNALLIGNIGLSAPLIIKALAASVPKPRVRAFGPALASKPSALDFLSGR